MCGIAVLVRPDARPLRPTIEAMVACLEHRGPDDLGFEVFEEDGVALGMRRLSILDLEGGNQPMWDENRQHCVVFNGEIYNFGGLRRALVAAGHRFATDHSDTEVLVHGFEEWGLDLLPRLNGMFAFAIWDLRHRRLVIARDRTGEKPLYVGRIGSGFAVASEMKALIKAAGVSKELDPVAVEQYLAFDYALGPRTVLRRVEKLPAAHCGVITENRIESFPYWKPSFSCRTDAGEPTVLRELDDVLDRSVRLRMVADVPVGLFLSGGLDSTAVGYYMRRHSDEVHSFSIGFEEQEYDESRYAQLAAESLGTTHHLEVFSQDRVRGLIPRIMDILDEPMGDQSIFPTYLLSVFTRKHVKVALGGDGSDELLMGYKAYQALKASWIFDSLPSPVRQAIAGAARHLPTHAFGQSLRGVQFARRLDRPPAHRLLAHLGSFKGNARWVLAPEMRAVLPKNVYESVNGALAVGASSMTPPNETIAAYLRAYLQEDILVKVDRASMAASLEVRAPFLDPALIDLTLAVPASLKLRGMTRKYLLRALMRGRVPDAIIDRPKVGFGIPLNSWMRGSLQDLVREYLEPRRIRAGGIFDADVVSLLVSQHLNGKLDRGNELWLLLQFELWRDRWLN